MSFSACDIFASLFVLLGSFSELSLFFSPNFFLFFLFWLVDCCSSLVIESKILGVFNCPGKCYVPAGTFFHFYLLSIAHFLIHSSFFDHVNFPLSVPVILVVANDGLAIGSPNSCLLCEVSLIVSCFVSLLIFISLTKIVLAISKQIVMSSHVSFQMPMGRWTKWNSKSKLV